jgi:type IV secretory pathway component VirB8
MDKEKNNNLRGFHNPKSLHNNYIFYIIIIIVVIFLIQILGITNPTPLKKNLVLEI